MIHDIQHMFACIASVSRVSTGQPVNAEMPGCYFPYSKLVPMPQPALAWQPPCAGLPWKRPAAHHQQQPPLPWQRPAHQLPHMPKLPPRVYQCHRVYQAPPLIWPANAGGKDMRVSASAGGVSLATSCSGPLKGPPDIRFVDAKAACTPTHLPCK